MMEAQYDLTVEDLIAFQRFHKSRSRPGSGTTPSKRQNFLFFVLLALLLGLTFASGDWGKFTFIAGLSIGIAVVLSLLFYLKIVFTPEDWLAGRLRRTRTDSKTIAWLSRRKDFR